MRASFETYRKVAKACSAYNKYLKGLTLTSEEEAYKDLQKVKAKKVNK